MSLASVELKGGLPSTCQ